MLLWGKMCAYLLSKDTFYYSASIKDKGYEKYIFWCLKVIQSHRKKIWVSTVHHVGEINCQTLKKTDSFWNNIPPGQCDPYKAMGKKSQNYKKFLRFYHCFIPVPPKGNYFYVFCSNFY